MEKVKNGDKEAYSTLIKDLKSELYSIAKTKISNEEDVKDILQETILIGYLKINQLKENKHFKTWLIRILINECNKFYRNQKKERILNKRYLEEKSRDNINENFSIDNIIEKLDDVEKKIFKLYYEDKHSVREISKILGIKVNTIKSKLSRGRKKIENKYRNGIVAVLILVLLTTGVVFAKEIVDYINRLFGGNTSDGLETAVNNGYVEEINTEYQEAGGISISIEEILMDDYNLAINFKLDFEKEYDAEAFKLARIKDLVIRDETGGLVFSSTAEKIREDEKEEYLERSGHSFVTTEINDKQLKLSFIATGNWMPFPRSKRLYINFTQILTKKIVNREEQDMVYEGNWTFEVDVPEEFYNRETVIYKAISCSEPEIDINKITATLSNTAFKVYIPEIISDKIEYGVMALREQYIENEKGEKFTPARTSDGDGGYATVEDRIIEYHNTFNLTKYDSTDVITLYILTNKNEEIIIDFESE